MKKMQCYSTNNKSEIVSLRQAVLSGMPYDGGLFMPSKIPPLSATKLNKMNAMSFKEIGLTVLQNILKNEIPENVLAKIVDEAFNFPVPLIKLEDNVFALELFHGPTLAFKDFAARFMSRLMQYYIKDSDIELTILTATSGDTGSAVADGFHNMQGIKVIILYPSGMVSPLQEKQLTTIGDNISALEIQGTFDDCQLLVKQAFLDNDISTKLNLTSANSINIARLIPQSTYYFYAFAQVSKSHLPVTISVPSGNFGNLTAGIIAKKMGLPVDKFVASVNNNDVFTKYLNTGEYSPQKTIKTISNAMDVGNPSNFKRILDLYNNDVNAIQKDIKSYSYSDQETRNTIQKVFENYNYVLDPHGAVGYAGLKKFLKENQKFQGVFLGTAHPAKFSNIVEDCISKQIEVPKKLEQCIKKNKSSVLLSKSYDDFKEFLYSYHKN